MVGRPELERFAAKHGLKIGWIEELIRYRLATEHTVERVDEREIDTVFGAFKLVTYRDRIAHELHFALVCGRPDPDTQTLVRVHVKNLLSDVLHWPRPDHGVAVNDCRKRVVSGRCVSVRVNLGGRRLIKE